MAGSVFSRIIAGELPASKVFEDDRTLAILDINPVNKGHVLVIPKEDYANIYDIPEDLFAHLMLVVKRLAPAIRDAVDAEGINIIMNNEPAAGQLVADHAHIHIVPRFHGDGHEHWHGKAVYGEGEKEEVAENIRKAIG
ncbi:HIT family protein [Patescibacteria group bacterium]|nr:HIT family protein [Patescibacteria group bacterium]